MLTTRRHIAYYKSRLLATLCAVAIGLLAAEARPASIFYDSGAGTLQSFSDPNSWALGVVPGPADTAIFTDLGSAYAVSFDSNPINLGLNVLNGSQPNFFPSTLSPLSVHVYTITGLTRIAENGRLILQGNTGKPFELRSQGNFRITDSTDIARSGRLDVLLGAQVTHAAGDFIIGDGPGSNGTMVIRVGGRVVDSGTDVTIARQSGSTGDVTVTDPNSAWQITAPVFDIGFAGDGTLTISNGGSVSSVDAQLGSGFSFAGSGTTQVTGSGSIWTNTADLTIRHSGALNIDTDATVDVGGTLDLSTSSSSISLSGGTLTAGAIDHSGGGAFNFTGGTLRTSNFTGNLTNAGGTFAPGMSPALATVSGDYTQLANGTLEIELDGSLAGDEYDQLVITGAASLDGTLDVVIDPMFTLQPGDSFSILTYGSRSGQFATIDGIGLIGDTFLTAIYDPTELRLVALFPGDGNLDGMVDGLDYLLWAGAFGDDPAADPPGSPANGDYNDDGAVDGIDYLVWAGNFGASAAIAVPEPAACGMFIVGVIACGVCRRRRAKAIIQDCRRRP